MTPLESIRRAAIHTRAAIVTEPGPVRDGIAAKADALQLWGLIGAGFAATAGVLALFGAYYAASSIGALCGLIPGLWEGVESDLRRTAAHDAVVSGYYLTGSVWLWWFTRRLVGAMAREIEGPHD